MSVSTSLTSPALPASRDRSWSVHPWLAYSLAWLAAAIVWSFASATALGRSPIQTFPYSALAMGTAGVMGVGVWHIVRRLPWEERTVKFWLVHGVCAVAYGMMYTLAFFLPDIARGAVQLAIQSARQSPATIWNVLMGSGLYLAVAGLSYAVRAQERIRDQEAAAAAAVLLAKQAQLVALRAQLQPHFLFNALHSVSALIPVDPEAADEAIERLGHLLRYTLADGVDAVPLAREWAFTRDYLAFEQLRFGDRLQIALDAEPDALQVSVPPLVVQPLVENSVRHGISDRIGGGSIRVTARLERDSLVLRVSDDGPGPAPSAARQHGLGLASLRQRLEAVYGGRARIDVETDAAGHSVTLVLPVL